MVTFNPESKWIVTDTGGVFLVSEDDPQISIKYGDENLEAHLQQPGIQAKINLTMQTDVEFFFLDLAIEEEWGGEYVLVASERFYSARRDLSLVATKLAEFMALIKEAASRAEYGPF